MSLSDKDMNQNPIATPETHVIVLNRGVMFEAEVECMKAKMLMQLIKLFSLFASIVLTLVTFCLFVIQKNQPANIFQPRYPMFNNATTAAITSTKRVEKTKFILSLGYHGREGAVMFKDCAINDCYFTENVNFMGAGQEDKFDAIIIAPMDFRRDEAARALTNMKRRPKQRYIMRFTESPRYPGFINKNFLSNDFFNWSMTYKPSSDIFVQKGYHYEPISNRNANLLFYKDRRIPCNKTKVDLAAKTKLAFWVVSDCEPLSHREDYVKALKNYVHIDVFGKCSNNRELCPKEASNTCFDNLSKIYKFYLAFENSLCSHYVTEKLFRTFELPLIPIVMGASNNYNHFPSKSMINVEHFPTVKELADYLLYLDKNHTAYMEYFEWKNSYFAYQRQPMCELCWKLHYHSEPVKSYGDMYNWWYTALPEFHKPACQHYSDTPYYNSVQAELISANLNKLNAY